MEGGGGKPKRRRREPPDLDHLSALPDSLLLHILSFLRMRDVVKTAVLSRRWRHLWNSTLTLDFSGRNVGWRPWNDYSSPDFVDRALILHGGAKVRTFCAAVPAGCEEEGEEYEISELARRVDSWIYFALRRGVEELDLDLDCSEVVHPDFTRTPAYTLPHSLFTCKSLVSLTLSYCRLDLPSRIFMSSLKILTLCWIRIDDHNLKGMLAGSPFLECLTLLDCNRGIGLGLHVEAANSRLRTLKIRDGTECEDCPYYGLTISTPGITTLILNGGLRDYYTLEDLSSLVTASLDLTFMWGWDIGFDEFQCLADLLCDLSHVHVLKLSSWCIQVLSVRPSECSRFSSDFNIKSLELDIGFLTCEFPGIFNALRNFTKLEFLTIDMICRSRKIRFMSDASEGSFVDETKYVLSNEKSCPTMLQHLRTVNILGLVRAICAEKTKETAEEKYQNAIEFIRFLLENSPVLEKLTIITTVNVDNLTKTNFEMLFRLASSLLNLPRASPNVLVIIKDV